MLIIIHFFTFFFQPGLIVFNESYFPFIRKLVWQIVLFPKMATPTYISSYMLLSNGTFFFFYKWRGGREGKGERES